MSKLSKATSKATGLKVTDEQIFNNVLRAMPANDLPEYRAGDSFQPYGQTFTSQPRVFNDYLDTLAIKYGLVFIKAFLAQNPLAYFKRGLMPYGGKIESVVFDTIAPKIYRPDLIDGEENPYAQNFGRVLGNTYTYYHDIESTNTVVDTQDTMYFQNLAQFSDFVFGKVSQLVNGAILDEFYHEKLVLSKSVADGMMTQDTVKPDNSKDLAKRIMYWTRKLKYFDTDSNMYGINQGTMVDDIVVIVPLNQSINLDTDYFANVFNAELTKNTHAHYIEVDAFPDVWKYTTDHVVTKDDIDNHYVSAREFPIGSTIPTGALAVKDAPDAELSLAGDSIGAIVLDRDALQLWDALPMTLSSLSNPKKRYSNLFINKKTAMMFVQALNSKVILMAD